MKIAAGVLLFCAICVAPGTILVVHWLTQDVETQMVVAERNQAETIKRMLTETMWQDSVKFYRDSLAKLHRRHNWEVLYGRELWR